MKITLLGGSLRPDSLTYQLLTLVKQKIEHFGIQTEQIDLRKLNLPFCNGADTYPDHPDVQLLQSQIQSSTGLVLATPEYHGSISGVLKNALDLLSEEHMKGKVVGLLALTGGIYSTNSVNTLRLICRHLHCWVLPEQIVVPHSADSFTTNGKLKDSKLSHKLNELVDHLVRASKHLGVVY